MYLILITVVHIFKFRSLGVKVLFEILITRISKLKIEISTFCFKQKKTGHRYLTSPKFVFDIFII